ncbi:MAG TPA: dipicolinate synthase subunit B [Firmicutes bacterium]|nr:dipicolinate synthase subunit B [Bacillota bacterium]
MQLAGMRIGLGLTGSYCTIPDVLPQMKKLRAEGAELFPIVSPVIFRTDTRFGKGEDVYKQVVEIAGREPWQSLVEVEPIGPKKLLDVMVVAPCTGTTLARLALGLSSTPVTLACKAQLRNNSPVVLAIATNDGLGATLMNLALIMNRRSIYFVPFRQDDPERKPKSLVADLELLTPTIIQALQGEQLQPVLL